MKKLITTAAFLMFGTLFINAQTTQKKDSKKIITEKPANSTEMKLQTPVQPNGMNRTTDTTTINSKSKLQDNTRKRLEPQTDGLNNEAVKPVQPAPGKVE